MGRGDRGQLRGGGGGPKPSPKVQGDKCQQIPRDREGTRDQEWGDKGQGGTRDTGGGGGSPLPHLFIPVTAASGGPLAAEKNPHQGPSSPPPPAPSSSSLKCPLPPQLTELSARRHRVPGALGRLGVKVGGGQVGTALSFAPQGKTRQGGHSQPPPTALRNVGGPLSLLSPNLGSQRGQQEGTGGVLSFAHHHGL